MTTYTYHVNLNDAGMIVYEAALKLLIEECRKEIAAGATAPFIAWLPVAERLLEDRYDRAEMTSTSSACWPLAGKTPE